MLGRHSDGWSGWFPWFLQQPYANFATIENVVHSFAQPSHISDTVTQALLLSLSFHVKLCSHAETRSAPRQALHFFWLYCCLRLATVWIPNAKPGIDRNLSQNMSDDRMSLLRSGPRREGCFAWKGAISIAFKSFEWNCSLTICIHLPQLFLPN